MEYEVYTEDPNTGKDMLIGIVLYRHDGESMLRNWANGHMVLNGKRIYQKGAR